MIFAQENNRKIPKEDKIFAINGRAKAAIAEKGKDGVVNATIGALLDDNGDLAVLSSVLEAVKTLDATDYAEYAPIGGTPAFKEAVKKAVFGEFTPKYNVEVCATPGGTGAIRNTVSNYSKPGDAVLTSDWFWAP
ncbi:MAG: aminotransferase class I/II-fold pyridoxal phosphate-dependent enzyme, partial [Anaerovoracaceae bacterium]